MVNPLTNSSTSGVSFAGIATGLNTTQLIQSLVAVESNAIKSPLLSKKSTLQSKLSALGTLEGKLSTLHTKAKALDTLSEFLAYTTSSSSSTILTGSADGNAIEGNHTIEVKQLAKNETETHSNTFADYDTLTVGTGTLTITYAGTANNITIDSSNNTLNGVAGAINAAGIDVTASVVNTGTPAAPAYKLVLTGKDTGASNTIVTDVSGLSGGTQPFTWATDTSADLVTASNAKFDVNGINDIERESNTVSDVIPGVTLTLLQQAVGTDVTLTVSKDTASVKQKINDFVSAYNDVASYIRTQSKYTQGQAVPPLFGDLALKIASSKMGSIISSVQNASSTVAANLAQIGIDTKIDGTLEVDDADLQEALDGNLADVGKLFATGLSGGGVAVQFDDWLEDYLSTADGLIKSEKDTINSTLSDIEKQILKADDKLAKLTDQLTKKFTDLETLVGTLQAQINYLSSVKFGFQ